MDSVSNSGDGAGFTRRDFLKVTGSSLVGLSFSGLLAGGLRGASGKTITLGGIFSLSGPNAAVGRTIRNGARVAVETVNSSGGVWNDLQFELVVRDGETSQTGASKAARGLAGRGDVDFVLGPLIGTHGRATQPILDGAGVPQVFFGTDVGFTERHDEYPLSIRFGTQTSLQFAPPVKYAVRERGDEKLFLLVPKNNQGKSIKNVTESFLAELEAGELVGSEFYPPFNRDFSSLMAKVLSSEAEGVVIGTGIPADLISVAREFDRQGLDPESFGYYTGQTPNGSVGFKKQVVDKGLGDGVIYSWHYEKRRYGRSFQGKNPPEEAVDMESAYREEYGSIPDSAPSASWGWGSVRILKQAIEGLVAKYGRDQVMGGLNDGLSLETINYLLPDDGENRGPVFRTPFGNASFLPCGQFNVRLGVATIRNESQYLLEDRGYGDEILPPLC